MKKQTATKECEQKRKFYTPQLSAEAVFFLRRLSWQQGKPMTQTLNTLVLSAIGQGSTLGSCQHCTASKEKCSSCKVKIA